MGREKARAHRFVANVVANKKEEGEESFGQAKIHPQYWQRHAARSKKNEAGDQGERESERAIE